jgi:cytoskeletal protein CcmA (bactofilin family)
LGLLNKIFGNPEAAATAADEPMPATSASVSEGDGVLNAAPAEPGGTSGGPEAPSAAEPAPPAPLERAPETMLNRRPQHPRHALVVSPISLSPDELRLLPGTRQRMPTLHGLGTGEEANHLDHVLPERPAAPELPISQTSSQREMTMPIEMNKTHKQTLVEQGTEFKGTIKSSCAVVVNGSVDGEVDAPEITITQSGAVTGAIKAKTLRSSGTLSGNVDAGDVFLSGSVRSNTVIKAKSLEVKLGSSERSQLEVTFGECNLEVAPAAREEDSSNGRPTSGDGPEVASKGTSPIALAASPEVDTLKAGANAGLGARSPWKSSRIIEVSASPADDSKTTLR